MLNGGKKKIKNNKEKPKSNKKFKQIISDN